MSQSIDQVGAALKAAQQTAEVVIENTPAPTPTATPYQYAAPAVVAAAPVAAPVAAYVRAGTPMTFDDAPAVGLAVDGFLSPKEYGLSFKGTGLEKQDYSDYLFDNLEVELDLSTVELMRSFNYQLGAGYVYGKSRDNLQTMEVRSGTEVQTAVPYEQAIARARLESKNPTLETHAIAEMILKSVADVSGTAIKTKVSKLVLQAGDDIGFSTSKTNFSEFYRFMTQTYASGVPVFAIENGSKVANKDCVLRIQLGSQWKITKQNKFALMTYQLVSHYLKSAA